MRFHLLGVGSIGSLFATHLAALDSNQVRLILRRKDLASQLLNSPSSFETSVHPHGTIKLERDGLVRKTTNLEMELTRNPADLATSRTPTASNRPTPKIDPSIWLRNDPIDTLIVTTKTPQTLPALRHILPRLSSRSTIVLCQNGMGTLEGLLEKYWPEDRSDEIERERAASSRIGASLDDRWHVGAGGRPSFICATTTHGAWRKAGGHFVHAGLGDIKFGVLPNRAVLSALSENPKPSWTSPSANPVLNPRSLVDPTLAHLPVSPATENLHATVSSLLSLKELHPTWLPLPTLQIAQFQKLAVNASINSLTALMGVNNGALIGSTKAKSLITTVSKECGNVFAAHLASEDGTWNPPSLASPSPSSPAVSLNQGHSRLDEETLTPSARSPPALPDHHPLSPRSLLAHTLSVLFKTSSNISSTLSDLIPLQNITTFSLDHAPSLPSRTEIDFINGYISALGDRYAIETPTVKALGQMVLLKEEMGRVGAVDRVWRNRTGPTPGTAAAAASSVGSGSDTERRGIATTSSPPRTSIFLSRAASSSGESVLRESRSQSKARGSSGSTGARKSHARAEKFDRITRDTRERARSWEIERIQRDKGHDQGG